jgi:Mn2+/Fe2+ NRAMP family transporter
MLGVPVLAGSCAYAIAEGAAWKGSLNQKPRGAKRFYGVIAIAVVIGLILNLARVDAIRMLFISAVLNGILAAPLILLVVLLTNDQKVMGRRVNSPSLRALGWITFLVMAAASIAMLFAE